MRFFARRLPKKSPWKVNIVLAIVNIFLVRRWYDRICPCSRAWLYRRKRGWLYNQKSTLVTVDGIIAIGWSRWRRWQRRNNTVQYSWCWSCSAFEFVQALRTNRRSRPSVDRTMRFHQQFVKCGNLTTGKRLIDFAKTSLEYSTAWNNDLAASCRLTSTSRASPGL